MKHPLEVVANSPAMAALFRLAGELKRDGVEGSAFIEAMVKFVCLASQSGGISLAAFQRAMARSWKEVRAQTREGIN